ncbi:MAG: molybdenum cofactor guanylyltransferase [Candidatus Omnitrophota bacterium]
MPYINSKENKVRVLMAAAVLAGGENSRMGGAKKAFIKVNGAFIIQHTLEILKAIFEEIILVTNSTEDFKSYQDRAIITQDIIKNSGPLGGIHSALSKTSKTAVFFVACDMPFLQKETIFKQAEYFNGNNYDCLLARVGTQVEPLHAVYKKNIAVKIKDFLKNQGDLSIKGFLTTLNVGYWDLADNSFNRNIFSNLNTREDLQRAGGQV